MFVIENPETFWLNVTNIALGAVTLICLIVVGRAAIVELLARARKRATVMADDHAFDIAGLGVTMADGGERIDAEANAYVSDRGSLVDSSDELDEPHIQRSEN